MGAGARIEPIAPGVAEQIEGEDGKHDGERGKDHHVGRIEEMTARVIEHRTPAWHRGEYSYA